jgi:hypothetical protein
LIDEHEFALRRCKLGHRFEGGFEECLLKRSPSSFPLLREIGRPPLRLIGERKKRLTSGYPKSRQQSDDYVKRRPGSELAKMAPRTAALDQECPTLRIVSEETDCASAVPMCERIRFILAFPIGKTDLEDSLAPIGERRRQCQRRVGVGKRVSEAQTPLLFAFLDEARELLEPRPSGLRCRRPEKSRVRERHALRAHQI